MNLSSFAALVEIAVLSVPVKGTWLGSLCLPLIRASDNPQMGSFCQEPYITQPMLPGTNRLLSIFRVPLIGRQQAWEHPVRPQITVLVTHLSEAVPLSMAGSSCDSLALIWSHVSLERALWKCLRKQSQLSTKLNCSRAMCILRRNSFCSPSTFLFLLLLHILCHHHITKWTLEIFPLHSVDFICALLSHNCLIFISKELIVLLLRENKSGINLI